MIEAIETGGRALIPYRWEQIGSKRVTTSHVQRRSPRAERSMCAASAWHLQPPRFAEEGEKPQPARAMETRLCVKVCLAESGTASRLPEPAAAITGVNMRPPLTWMRWARRVGFAIVAGGVVTFGVARPCFIRR